jgi:hypothetical protein
MYVKIKEILQTTKRINKKTITKEVDYFCHIYNYLIHLYTGCCDNYAIFCF